jgi:hypothetical protein
MKTGVSARGLFVLGFIILAATNIVVLTGVAANRSGSPEARLTLTERELQLPYSMFDENSGLSLRLVWRILSRDEDELNLPGSNPAVWFNAEKLEELGFAVNDYLDSPDRARDYKKPLSREVFIVLEEDGEAYREAVQRAKTALAREQGPLPENSDVEESRRAVQQAEKRVTEERLTQSRLFAIDAGLDPEELRAGYPDRSRFIIARALVTPRFYEENGRKKAEGYINRLSIQSIHVPLKHRQLFDTILAQDRSKGREFRRPRYQVTVAYGSRLEPWIESVRPLGDSSE